MSWWERRFLPEAGQPDRKQGKEKSSAQMVKAKGKTGDNHDEAEGNGNFRGFAGQTGK